MITRLLADFKRNWEIDHNLKLFIPLLGILASLYTAWFITQQLLKLFAQTFVERVWIYLALGITLVLTYAIIKLCLWIFKKLEHRWKVNYRWELISIFIVFALTGSLSAKLSSPLLDWLGFNQLNFYPILKILLRLILIFPVYQILLIFFGSLFGQFRFFWNFEKKMLSRIGLSFLIKTTH
ncbi:MAG: hypothetical protein RQ756_06765 [Flavobacteriaceae bacterium]|nr:hypothetical protein [Flavobacteriaceae bacterium]